LATTQNPNTQQQNQILDAAPSNNNQWSMLDPQPQYNCSTTIEGVTSRKRTRSRSGTTERKRNCTVKLEKIILDGLTKLPVEESGLDWVNYNQTFSLDFDIFEKYYRYYSDAKLDSIKNRLTKTKSSFYVISEGDTSSVKIFTSDNWSLVYEKAGLKLVEPVYPPTSNTTSSMIEETNHSLMSEDYSLVTISDQIKEQFPGTNSTDLHHLKVFLRAEGEQLPFNESSLEKFKRFDTVPRNSYEQFIYRFGPFENLIQNIQQFIDNGAKFWFIGKASRDHAQNILKNSKHEYCHLIRISAESNSTRSNNSDPDMIPIYVLSYRRSIQYSHRQIFKHKTNHKLYVHIQNAYKEVQDFTKIISTLELDKSEPISNLSLCFDSDSYEDFPIFE